MSCLEEIQVSGYPFSALRVGTRLGVDRKPDFSLNSPNEDICHKISVKADPLTTLALH